jgi:SAM-dependent methyltransferase
MPMDWQRFYDEADYDVCAYLGGEAMPDHLDGFVERVGEPDDLASVGCGPAVTEFAFAERNPDVDVWCCDVSETVVEDGRQRADEAGLDSLAFAVDSLPDLDVDRRFDLVYCMAVLYFVADVERAVEALYDRVRPGGHLVFNYANRPTRARFDREFEGRKREAFELVLDGENLLSYDAIEDVLGRRPRSYWTAVGADDPDYTGRDSPAVYVRKPD